MGARIRGKAGHFEIFDSRERRDGAPAVQFASSSEALRFLHDNLRDPDDLPYLRRWAHDMGRAVVPHVDILHLVASELHRGGMWVAEVALSSSGYTLNQDKPKGGGGGGGSQPKPAPKVAELAVHVKDLNGRPVKDVKVVAGAAGTKNTDENGTADFGPVQPGTYDITAEKPGHGKVRNGAVEIDERKGVNVPDGTKTEVNLIQHPECATVAFFEGSTTRSKYFGFDHKTNIVATGGHEYWTPVPAPGSLTLPGNKETRDGARWVSVAVGEEVEVEINFDFKTTECIPCIANSEYEVVPASVADVVTKSVTSKKAVFKIKGKAKGEASLKVKCDGKDEGWFHIWCENAATIKLDVACIITNRAPAATYSLSALRDHFNDIFRQALITLDMFDLGTIDLTGDAALATVESTGYPPAAGEFLSKSGTPRPYDSKGAVLTALHNKASAALGARSAAPLPRSGAYRLYWYVPTAGCSILGTVMNIGSNISFGFQPDSSTARNSCAHEFGHSLNLRHPSDPSCGSQYAAHNLATLGNAVPAYAATNTEPSSLADPGSGNVLANDPTNLMGYWSDRPNRKPLRYHQWKTASRS